MRFNIFFSHSLKPKWKLREIRITLWGLIREVAYLSNWGSGGGGLFESGSFYRSFIRCNIKAGVINGDKIEFEFTIHF